jgi:hypothetical protein
MHRALMSLSIGDPDKPSFSPFVPPPIQRLSLPPTTKSTSPSSSSSNPVTSPKSKQSPRPTPGPSTCNPSAIFPYLHRLEIRDDMGSRRQQRPLLVLKLSSPSFLDSVATDLVAETPLYSVETVGSSTTIWRSDPWDASVKIADICWPKDLPLKGKGRDTHGAIIQMGDPRWKDTDSYLKYGGLGKCASSSLMVSLILLFFLFHQLPQIHLTKPSPCAKVEANWSYLSGNIRFPCIFPLMLTLSTSAQLHQINESSHLLIPYKTTKTHDLKFLRTLVLPINRFLK